MTASAINVASTASVAQPGAGVAGKPAAAAGLAGFEALLGALFPEGEAAMPPATPNGQPGAATAGTPVVPDALLNAGAKKADGDTAESAAADGQPTAGDAATALAASLVAVQPVAVPADPTTPGATDNHVASSPPAWGRDKPAGAPAMPAILAANAKAGLTQKAQFAAEVAGEAQPDGEPSSSAVPPMPGSQAAPPHNAAPAPPPVQPPVAAAEVQPETPVAAVVAEAPPVEAPLAETPPAALTTSLTAGPEPAPAQASSARAAKPDRAKVAASATSTEASDDLKPLEASDKPAHAKAAQGAAKTASATGDAAEAEPQDTRTAPESPDATPQGETRAAAQAAAPASTHTTHAVRGSPETVANLAAQILKKLEGKSTRFDVELDPHGLGKVDVRIEIGAQGRITAGMTFDNPQAAADVKARAAELHRALEQAGFDLSGGLTFDVASDRGQQQQNQAWQDQGDTGRAFQGRAFRAALETAGDAADAANQGALRLRRGVNSGLDLRI